MKRFAQWLILCLKGIGMGAANVVPGVSGGTIAFITGIYERLVNAINNFDRTALKMMFSGRIKEAWKHIDGTFLTVLMAGVGIATLSLAKLMVVVLTDFPVQTWAFFFGLIIASSVLMLAGVRNYKALDSIWIATGIALGIAVCTLTPVNTPDGLWFIFICGAVSICAMILPGISGSFILLVMGKYEYVMESIVGAMHLDGHSIATLAVFAIGCVVGILAFAKFLHWLLDGWNRQTMLVLTGFVLGSLVKVWPWSSPEALDKAGLPTEGFPDLVPAIIFCIAGIVLVLGLEWLGRKGKAAN